MMATVAGRAVEVENWSAVVSPLTRFPFWSIWLPDMSRTSGPITAVYVPLPDWAGKATSNLVLLDPATAVTEVTLIAPGGPLSRTSAVVKVVGSIGSEKVSRRELTRPERVLGNWAEVTLAPT